MELADLKARAARRRRVLDAAQGEMRSVLLRGKSLQGEVEDLGTNIEELDRVTHFLNSMGEDRQFDTQQKIEELVTRGLQAIFDDSLSFHIVQSTSGKSVTVNFVMRTTLDRDVIDTPVLDARGGGVAATIGFLLRLVVMLLSKGQRHENFLVLDETFGMVSAEYLPAVVDFLQEVVTKTGVQILMVTHQEIFSEGADVVYRFHIEDGKTVVEKR